MSGTRNGRSYPPARGASDAAPAPRSDTATPRLGLVQPEVGASASTWGNKWNNNAAILDNAITTAGGEIAGSVTVDGDFAVKGHTAVGGAGINYTGVGAGHNIAYGWDGSGIQAFIDTTYEGNLATQQWVDANFPTISYANANYATFAWVAQNFAVASNTLPLTGGTITGNLSVDGTANLNAVAVFSVGIHYAGVGPGHAIAFGWDGAFLQAFVDGSYIGDFAPRAGRDAAPDAVSELKAENAALAARLRALEERP